MTEAIVTKKMPPVDDRAVCPQLGNQEEDEMAKPSRWTAEKRYPTVKEA